MPERNTEKKNEFSKSSKENERIDHAIQLVVASSFMTSNKQGKKKF